MTPKKNPKADLSRKTGLFFAIGLAIAVSISLFAITFETSTGKSGNVGQSKVNDKLDEDDVDEVVMNPNTPPPPPPPPTPEVPEEIKQVDNTVETKKIEFTTETDKNDKVEAPKQEFKQVEEEAVPDDVIVPFSVIEDKPMFEACKSLPKAQQDDCFKKQLDSHVQKNFKYPEMAAEMGIQGRVFVQFKINKDGKVEVTGVRGPDKSLEAEARRIIEKMPKLEPGKQRGKPVAVTYSYPIMFKLN